MKRIVFITIVLLIIFSSGACTPLNSKEPTTIAQSTPATAPAVTTTISTPAGAPVYLSGQVEWIARSFSPECRLRKADVVKVGG
jgi:hypothetical protein